MRESSRKLSAGRKDIYLPFAAIFQDLDLSHGVAKLPFLFCVSNHHHWDRWDV